MFKKVDPTVKTETRFIALVVLILRIKLMERAWHGRRFELPLLERLTCHFY